MRRLCFALLFAACCPPLAAESNDVDPLFASDEVFSITLTGPLRAIAYDRSDDPKFRPAQLSFVGPDGAARNVEIGLRARGKSRRNPDACDFPPLRLDLPKQGTEGTVFAGQDKLKLVTQCQSRDRNHRFEQYLLKEYVLYRVFNRLTEQSFRARLVQVTYAEKDSHGDAPTSFGFFIEDKDHLAQRIGAKVADVKEISRSALEPRQTNRVELFQFMIGNTDFSLLRGPADEACCHNSVPLVAADGTFVTVPYDFDATGVVDPPYALPLEVLRIDNVKDRRYRGRCVPDTVFKETLEDLRSARADIEALLTQQAGLQMQTVKTAVAYIGGFYSIIDDPKQFERQILRECRK